MGRKRKSAIKPPDKLTDAKLTENKQNSAFNEFFGEAPAASPKPLKLTVPDVVSNVPVQLGTSPPPENVVEVEGGCIKTPLSKLMAQNSEICCAVCGKPLPLRESDVKTVVISGERYMACKGCFVAS